LNLFAAPDPLRPGQRRLRAAWRIAGQLFLMAAFSFALLLPLVVLQMFGIGGNTIMFAAQQVVSVFAITGSVYLARRLLDRRTFRSLGLETGRQAWRDLLAGIVIAAIMMTSIFVIEWLAGWITFASAGQAAAQPAIIRIGYVLALLLVFFIVGWQEELFARGYLLKNLIDGLNIPWAVVISSSVFALAHLGNPNVSPMSMIGLLLAGVFFAWAALLTGQLWLPIGLHIGWNFFEGPVFGFPVSGLTFNGLLSFTTTGPEQFTGGAFGPEAGLVLLPALALGALLVWMWTKRRPTD
jgi:uncharacterized protein